jgi:hypothetical protein
MAYVLLLSLESLLHALDGCLHQQGLEVLALIGSPQGIWVEAAVESRRAGTTMVCLHVRRANRVRQGPVLPLKI